LATAQKTLPHGGEAEVEAFLKNVPAQNRREDAFKLLEIMRRVTGVKPVMWGTSIVGFGTWRYAYAGGGEGIAPRAGFSPRSNRLVIYLPLWQSDIREQLAGLGPHEASVSCLYLKSLADVDRSRLEKLLAAGFKSDVPFPGRGSGGKPATKRKAVSKAPGKKASSKKTARKPTRKVRKKG
jgi:hypothetical protein